MREEPHAVIAQVSEHSVELPDTPYALWARGELDRFLRIPDDGTRVEVIGREIVVSPPASNPHNKIAIAIHEAFFAAQYRDASFPWRIMYNSGLSLVGGDAGVVPDLMIMGHETYDHAGPQMLVGDEIELVVEIASPSNAKTDREPERPPQRETKWQWYARAEIPYYLLVDADPKIMRTTLYSIPDHGSAAYPHSESWAFGETITLPDPFGIEIPTTSWQPWSAADADGSTAPNAEQRATGATQRNQISSGCHCYSILCSKEGRPLRAKDSPCPSSAPPDQPSPTCQAPRWPRKSRTPTCAL